LTSLVPRIPVKTIFTIDVGFKVMKAYSIDEISYIAHFKEGDIEG
jgi:hypothetical protein